MSVEHPVAVPPTPVSLDVGSSTVPMVVLAGRGLTPIHRHELPLLRSLSHIAAHQNSPCRPWPRANDAAPAAVSPDRMTSRPRRSSLCQPSSYESDHCS